MALVLLVVTAAVYFNSVKNPFYFDDITSIKNNRGVASLKNLRFVFSREKYFELFAERSYRPVTSTIFLLLKRILPDSPAAWRLFNLLIHFANAFLLFLLLRRFELNEGLALLAASLFAVHTVHTETINVISFNRDIVGGFFSLLAFHCFFREGIFFQMGSLALYFLSCLVKETFIVLPALLFFFQWFYDEDGFNWRRLLKSQIGFILAAVLFLFISFAAMKNPDPLYRAYYPGGSLSSALLTFAVVLIYYLRLFFLPVGLTPIYDFPVHTRVLAWPVALSLFTLALIAALIVDGFRKRQGFSLYLTWFFLYLLPTSNLLPTGKIIAERFMYFPLMGLVTGVLLLIDLAVSRLGGESGGSGGRRKLLTAFGLTALLFFSVLTIKRNQVWQNPGALWRDAIKKMPTKTAKSLVNLGYYYQERKNYSEAIKQYKLAIKENPLSPLPFSNIGRLYQRKKQYQMARPYYEKAVQRKDGYQDKNVFYQDLLHLAETCVFLEDYPATLKYLQRAKAINPQDSTLYYNLALVYRKLGKTKEAVAAKEQYRRLSQPED